MKSFVYILILLLPFFASCSEELRPDEIGEKDNCIVLAIQNSSMKTKAGEAQNVENLIKTLDFFFYPAGGTESGYTYKKNYQFNEVVEGVQNLPIYLTDADWSRLFPNDNIHSCVVYAIANLSSSVSENTTLSNLKKIVIEASGENAFIDGDEMPITPSSFVMYGEQTLTRENVNDRTVSGHISMYRAASKITLKINLPTSIQVPLLNEDGTPVLDSENNPIIETWEPIYNNQLPQNGVANLNVGFHKGLSKSYVDARLPYPSEDDDFFETADVENFTYKGEVQYAGVTYHSYTCDLTFYSFSRAWEQGAIDAPYFILCVPWRRAKAWYDQVEGNWIHKTYFYQVQINPLGRTLTSNHWYDLTLNVGVLGSTIKTEPKLLTSCSYTVLDWSHIETVHEGNHEEIHLDEWRYLVIDQNRIEMNNTTEAVLPFRASHNIKWNVEWPTGDGSTSIIAEFDELERFYNDKNNYRYAAYYLNSRPTTGLDAIPEALNEIDKTDFKVSASSKSLEFTYPSELTQRTPPIYSPSYIHLKVWLDIDGEGDKPTGDELGFVEHITFVYYPEIYVIPDQSTLRSVYVNGVKHQTSHDNIDVIYNTNYNNITIKHELGSAAGYRDTRYEDDNYSMFVINVTSFKSGDNNKDGISDDSFVGPTFNFDNEGGWSVKTPIGNNSKHYKYIIGDPRQRSYDYELDYNDNHNMSTSVYTNTEDNTKWTWRTPAPHVDGQTDYRMFYYYPTASDATPSDPINQRGYSFQVIAPKFRIVSFNNASRSECSAKGAAMRCATLQEDGFPAGRWRLPTIAEIQFIINLQKNDAIQDIFLSSSSRYATALYATDERERLVTLTLNKADKTLTWDTPEDNISVRCVYDDWYWGSEREAIPGRVENGVIVGNDGEAGTGDDYLFTWGDRKIIW